MIVLKEDLKGMICLMAEVSRMYALPSSVVEGVQLQSVSRKFRI